MVVKIILKLVIINGRELCYEPNDEITGMKYFFSSLATIFLPEKLHAVCSHNRHHYLSTQDYCDTRFRSIQGARGYFGLTSF